MKYFLFIFTFALLLSACSFVQDDQIKKIAPISVNTFLRPILKKNIVAPTTNTSGSIDNPKISEKINSITEPKYITTQPLKAKGEKTKTFPQAASSGSNTDLSEKEIEGLVNSLFSDLQ